MYWQYVQTEAFYSRKDDIFWHKIDRFMYNMSL